MQSERVPGTVLSAESSPLSFEAVLRETVLACLGKATRGPFLEEGGAGEDLRVNPGDGGTRNASRGCKRAVGGSGGTASHGAKSMTDRNRGATGTTFGEGPLSATRTVLLVKGRTFAAFIPFAPSDKALE